MKNLKDYIYEFSNESSKDEKQNITSRDVWNDIFHFNKYGKDEYMQWRIYGTLGKDCIILTNKESFDYFNSLHEIDKKYDIVIDEECFKLCKKRMRYLEALVSQHATLSWHYQPKGCPFVYTFNDREAWNVIFTPDKDDRFGKFGIFFIPLSKWSNKYVPEEYQVSKKIIY